MHRFENYTPLFISEWVTRLAKSPMVYRLFKGSLWSLAGTLVARGSGVVSMILIARIIGKTELGEFGMIQSTVGIFGAVAGMGMGLTSTKFIAEYKETDKASAASMLGLSGIVTWTSGILMTLVMFLIAPWFALHTLAAPHLTSLLQTGSLLLLFGSVNGAQTGALAGFEAFKAIARVSVISSILTFPLMVLGASYWNLNGAVYGLLASQIINCLLSHLALRKEARAANIPLWAPLKPAQWGVLWRFSLPSILCNMILGPAGWACSAMLANRPNGYAEIGIYNVTLSWFNIVFLIPGVVGQVLLPMLASSEKKNDSSRDTITLVAVKANLLATVPAVIIITLLSPYIMSLYGSGFSVGWKTLSITVLTSAVLAIQLPLVQAITASGRMWFVFATYLLFGIVSIFLTYHFVLLGSLGLSLARLIAYVFNGILTYWMFVILGRKRLL